MKKIVYCWELGGNYGHITSFLPFYRELVKAGLQVDFVVYDLSFAQQLLGEYGVRYFQAPLPKGSAFTSTYSYVDLLAQVGYTDSERLISCVYGWRNLLSLLQADIVIADHAPTALLAARTLDIPAVMFGSGFSNPPMQNPLPLFPVWNNVPDVIAYQHHQSVLNNINVILDHFACVPINAICDLFDVAQRFLCTTSELDHYLERKGEEYWGPQFIDDIGVAPVWPDVMGPKIFAYITPQIKQFEYLLAELQNIAGSKLVHIPNASAELIARYSRADLNIEMSPVQMKAVVKHANLVIHQGGIGTASVCALAGVRQVLIPTQLEQRMVCKKLVSQGLAYGVDPEQDYADYQGVFEKALVCPQLGQRARMFHQQYFGFDQREQYASMAEVIVDILQNAAQ
jgi:hypothetical protein